MHFNVSVVSKPDKTISAIYVSSKCILRKHLKMTKVDQSGFTVAEKYN